MGLYLRFMTSCIEKLAGLYFAADSITMDSVDAKSQIPLNNENMLEQYEAHPKRQG